MRRAIRLVAASLLCTAIAGCGIGAADAAPVLIERYSRTADARTIIVYFTIEDCDVAAPATVTESAATVTVEVLVARAPDDKPCDLKPVQGSATVTLKADLNGRAVRGPKDDVDVPEVPATPAP